MALNRSNELEKPFLFGVTRCTPEDKKRGYSAAIASEEVLSTRITGPGAEVRNLRVSSGKLGGLTLLLLEARSDSQVARFNPE